MNTITLTQEFTVNIAVDKAAALLAGRDDYSNYSLTVKPSQLTPKQRETLIALNFTIHSNDVGIPISGAETVEELLDRAAPLMEARQKKNDAENALCITTMTTKLTDAPLSDRLSIDDDTGLVTVERLPGALLKLDNVAVTKSWTYYSYGSIWASRAQNNDKQALELREAVLNNPVVAQKIQLAMQKAECLQRKLDAAKAKREALAAERKAEQEQFRLAAQRARQSQLETFVAKRMTEVQQRRRQAGLMTDEEVIDAIGDEVFKPLNESLMRYTQPDGAEFEEQPLSSVSDNEFLGLEQVKRFLPGAEVTPVQYFGHCDEYAELGINVWRVTVQVGTLTLSRDYLLN